MPTPLSPSAQAAPWIEVKKDWVYQRKKTLIFKSWQPRFMVLYSGPIPAIALYEQRSDSVPPYAPALHLELNSAVTVEAWKGSAGSSASGKGNEFSASIAGDDHASLSQRRPSLASMASEQLRFQQRSKKQNEENALVLYKADFKLVVAMNCVQERDEWIERIKEAIAGTGQNNLEESNHRTFLEAEASTQASKRPSLIAPTTVAGGLSLLGVTVIKESKLARLQANQPTLLSQSSSDEPILNEISLSTDFSNKSNNSSSKLISNVFPEELISLYYGSLKAYKSADSADAAIKANLNINRVLGSFNDAVLKYVRLIIDEYHKKVPVSSSAVYEFGPIKISLLPGYNQNDESIIEYTSAVNRQELHAVKLINSCTRTQVNTMLVTCVEYKGFRFSAYLEVPLGSNTITIDLNPQDGKGILLKDDQLELLNSLGAALKLTPSSHIRLPGDNRSVALCLPGSVELHQLPRSVAGYPKGPYVINLSQIPPSWPSNPNDPLLCGLYRFRPEFLTTCYQGPLSAGEFNAEKSAAALKFLHEEHLPSVLNELEALEEMPVDSAEWTQYLHGKGINCVLMGRMAGAARLPHIKEALLVEMIARTAKRAIAAQLRGSILHFKEVQALRVDDELRAIVLHTMATIVGNTPLQMQGYVRELLEAVYFKFNYRVDLEAFRRLPRAALFLAICHHSGLQFVDRVYDFGVEAPFAKEDFLMFIPTADSVMSPSNTLYSLFCTGGANHHTATQQSSILDALNETEALSKLASAVLPQGEASWQYPTGRASISRQMLLCSALHARQKRPSEAAKFAELAKATVPRVHCLRAFIHVQAMEQRVAAFKASPSVASSMAQRELLADLKRQYSQAVLEVEAHLGPHHPLQICAHQQAAQVFAALGTGATAAALNESLQARGNALASATKSLGRIHKWTRQQVLKIGDVNKEMGAFDEALTFYNDALKSAQQCGDGAVFCAQIQLSISACQQAKGNLDEALQAAQEARSWLESTTAIELYESALTSVAQLAQSLYEDVKEDATTVLSGAIQSNLSLAVECYERLFEGVRQRPEIDPARLLSVLKKIISLKMRLARPAHKILLFAIKARKHQVSQSAVSDCIMRIVSAPTASAFMDRNLERLEKPALAAAITSGSVSTGEAKEIFEEFSCLLQIVEN